MSKITTILTTGVTFGSPGYLGPLSITSTGGIEPGVQGTPALYIPTNAVKPTLTNSGVIIGGSNSDFTSSLAGGMGVDVHAAAFIENENAIAGGYGVDSNNDTATAGGIGIGIFVAHATLVNDSFIAGGDGGFSADDNAGYGGAGVAIYAASTVTNFGHIEGGVGGAAGENTGRNFTGAGGKGVLLSGGATLTNAGYITGGYGGGTYYPGPAAGYGGEGLLLTHASATNLGMITGGHGGTGSKYAYYGRRGGIGVEDDSGKFNNQGTIFGGIGGFGTTTAGNSAAGVDVNGAGAFGKNTGLIEGGQGVSAGNYGYAASQGGAGLTIAASASFTNSGQIIGGGGGDGGPKSGESGAGAGAGAILRGATVTNSGLIEAGRGGYDAAGVSGAILYGAKLVNSGTVIGGYGGQGGEAGGAGIIAGSIGTVQSHLNNSGHIIGGTGGYGDTGGTGGIGVQISATSVLNTGHILGGTGGGALHYGGNGGLGAEIISGTLTNEGVIKGGAGGPSRYNYSGGSGVGVRMEGGTLINAGTIATSAAYGSAVYIPSTAVGTVVVEPGAVFIGYVDAYRPQNDVLVLSGAANKTFTGIGTQIYGFNIIDFAVGAKWKISGDTAGLTNGQHIDGFAAGDTIKITNAVIANGTVNVKTAGVLTISGPGGSFTIDVDGANVGSTNFHFSNDTLTKTMANTAMEFIASPAAPVPAEKSMRALSASLLADQHTAPPGIGPLESATLPQWPPSPAPGAFHGLLMTPHQGAATIGTPWQATDSWSHSYVMNPVVLGWF